MLTQFKHLGIDYRIFLKFSFISMLSVCMIFFSFRLMALFLSELMTVGLSNSKLIAPLKNSIFMNFSDTYIVFWVVGFLIFIYLFGYTLTEYSKIVLQKRILASGTREKIEFYRRYLEQNCESFLKTSLNKHFFALSSFGDFSYDAIQAMLNFVPILIRFFSYVLIMLWVSFWLGLLAVVISLISFPVSNFIVYLFHNNVREKFEFFSQNEASSIQRFEALISNIPLIQYSGKQEEELKRFSRVNSVSFAYESGNVLISGLNSTIHFLKNSLVILLHEFLKFFGAIGHMGVFFYGLFGLEKETENLANVNNVVLKAKFAADEANKILQIKNNKNFKEGNIDFSDLNYGIEFVNVFFDSNTINTNKVSDKGISCYKFFDTLSSFFRFYEIKHKEKKVVKPPKISIPFSQSRPIIDSLNVFFPAKKFSLIMGETGAGKTTLLYLLMRLFDYSKGNILLDRKAISEYKLSSFYEKIGFVQQDYRMLNRSLRENLVYGINRKLNNKRIILILEKLGLMSLLKRLKRGLNTKIGYRGIFLSEGENQRIAIARLLLSEPKIALFDEATSALDLDTEKKVIKVIKEELENKTVIFVTHRASIMNYADIIFFMEKGKISKLDERKVA